MLVITLVVFVQYVIGDLQERYAGSRPQMSAVLTYQQDEGNTYLEKNTGKSFSSAEANDYFNKTYMLPYESKRLVIGTLVNVPVFIVAVLLLLGKGTMRSSVRLGINAVFAASLLNMLRLLGELASFAYTVNQKMTMYGVSAILILVFFGSIVFIQEKHAKTNP